MKKYLIAFSSIISLFLGCSSESNTKIEKGLSIYLRDTIDVYKELSIDSVYYISSEYSLVKIENGKLWLENPLSLNPDSLHTTLFLQRNGKVEREIGLSIKCWKDSVYYLEEVTTNLNIKKNIFVRRAMYCLIKLGLIDQYPEILLATVNDISYIYANSKLYKEENLKRTLVCSNFPIEDRENIQFIVDSIRGGIYRTGHSIYISDNSLQNWKEIYSGPRQIKESMYLNSVAGRLLFSQYTPGLVRQRHYLLRYTYSTERIDTIKTFYTRKDFEACAHTPIARHIHLLNVDPYTGNVFVGTGDEDDESAIYISKDSGDTFSLVGSGNQFWRTLSILYDKNYIYFNTDSPSPQYLTRISRKNLDNIPVPDSLISRLPLFNSALWNCAYSSDNFVLMSSNSEGMLYDNSHRIYGFFLNNTDWPIIYNLFEEQTSNRNGMPNMYHQLTPYGRHTDGIYWYYDTHYCIVRKFKLVRR